MNKQGKWLAELSNVAAHIPQQMLGPEFTDYG
jgi:hypothetical protein